jgi:hypothetical protein
MAYIACVRYGTSNSGYFEYLTTSSLSGALMLSPIWLDKATKFPTKEAAKEAVHEWCTKRRAELERINIHSGQAWNQTREGAWKYEEVEDVLNKSTNLLETVYTF